MRVKYLKVFIGILALSFIFAHSAFAADNSSENNLSGQMAELILQLGIIIFAAWFGGYIFRRMRLPRVLGEIIAGIIIGPYCLGTISLPGFSQGLFPFMEGFPVSPELYGIATIASIILLFLIGAETNIQTFLRFSFVGSVVGLFGVIASFVLGDVVGVIFSKWAFGTYYGFGHPIPLFLGVISSATSVGISARILSEKRKMDSPEGITILTAAVIDDVLGIIALAIVIGIAKSGHLVFKDISLLALKSLGIWLGFTVLGLVFSTQLSRFVKAFKNKITISVMSLAMAFILAGVFEHSGLAMIIGAYVMGLSFAKTEVSHIIRNNLESMREFFVPIFFCVMGMLVNLKEMASPTILIFGLAYLITAIISKLFGCGIPAWFLNFTARGATAVGVGMIPRGEVALIIAGIGLSTGIVPHDVFSVAVLMTFVTTMATPALLEKLILADKPMLRKIPKIKDEHKEISYDLPNIETAELVLGKTVLAFEKEGFYVYPIETNGAVVYEMRKNETSISLFYEKERVTFHCLIKDLTYVHTVFYEVIVEIEYALKSLQEKMDHSIIGKNIFDKQNGLHIRESNFSSVIHPVAVKHSLTAQTKLELLYEIVEILIKSGQLSFSKKENVVTELMNRENSMSTGMQDSIAFPHCRSSATEKLVSAIGVHKKGFDFKSLDGKPSQIFVLTLIPESYKESYLQYISNVSRLLSNEQNRNKIISSRSDKELYELFTRKL